MFWSKSNVTMNNGKKYIEELKELMHTLMVQDRLKEKIILINLKF